jgi:zinc transporter 1/2/3
MGGSTEYLVQYTATGTEEPPAEFTDCHAHDADLFCVAPDGSDVLVSLSGGAAEEGQDEHGEHGDEETSAESEGETCHFHAGVE